jgi:hypothetical protein
MLDICRDTLGDVPSGFYVFYWPTFFLVDFHHRSPRLTFRRPNGDGGVASSRGRGGGADNTQGERICEKMPRVFLSCSSLERQKGVILVIIHILRLNSLKLARRVPIFFGVSLSLSSSL